MALRDARLGRVATREGEHLVGHVEPEGEPGLADTPRGEDHVDSSSRAEVEHRLALARSPRRRSGSRTRARPAPLSPEARSAARRRTGPRRTAPRRSLRRNTSRCRSRRPSLPCHGAGRFGVAAAHLFAQFLSTCGGMAHAPLDAGCQATSYRSLSICYETSTAASASTRRRMSSRIARTSSSGSPFGSGMSQSS